MLERGGEGFKKKRKICFGSILLIFFVLSEDGKHELMRLGALPVIITALQLHPQNFDIQQDCINILLNMSHGSEFSLPSPHFIVL
jgi:hypothetical protein